MAADPIDAAFPQHLADRARRLIAAYPPPIDLNDPRIAAFARSWMPTLGNEVQNLAARSRVLKVQKGSRFEVDDRVKPFDPPSQQVIELIANGVSHLELLAASHDALGRWRPPIFTLSRVAIEAAAAAFWIMKPGTIDARVRHSIRWTWHQRGYVASYTGRAVGESSHLTTVFVRDALLDIASRRPGLRGLTAESLGAAPSNTQLVEALDARVSSKTVPPSQAWRQGSGVAHSGGSFISSTLATPSPGVDETVLDVLVMAMTTPAIGAVDFALTLAERHLAPTPGKTKIATRR